ncbi:hypothetical protein [Streptomyces tendae]|uniref:hypothetical protein n=1 Tax=Streptomyces tendae TaxID=1932 RepID=UPI0036913E11
MLIGDIVIALGDLSMWTAYGSTGSPARIVVSSGQVVLPYGATTETAAFYDVPNIGGANDRLIDERRLL